MRSSLPIYLFVAVVTLSWTVWAQAATVTVSTGSDPRANGAQFQAALNAANCGDTIILKAGATYGTQTAFVSSSGPQGYPFILPNKGNCNGQYITIQTSNLGGLPPTDTRVAPGHASAMARIVSYNNAPAVAPARSAGWYKFVGIEFTNDVSVAAQNGHTNSLIEDPDGGYFPFGAWPHHIVIDRCFFHPIEETANPSSDYRSVTRGVALNGVDITIQNSYFSGFTGWYRNSRIMIDSSAILVINGQGPYRIVNNFLEAWFNNLFTGGGSMATPNTATLSAGNSTNATLTNVANLAIGDLITFKMPAPFTNTSGYPSSWGTARVTAIVGTTVSFVGVGPDSITSAPAIPGTARWNGFNASNIQVLRNTLNKRPEWAKYGQTKAYWEMKSGVDVVFDGNVMQGYLGNSIGIVTFNQTGDSPWTTVKNVRITNNYLKGVGNISVTLIDPYRTNVPGGNILISNNLLTGGSGNLYFVLGGGGSGVTISHNTVRRNPNSMLFWTGPTGGMVFKDNVIQSGSYWFNCTVGGLSTCWPSLTQNGNVVINTSGSVPPAYASTNFVVSSDAAVGFVNSASADTGGDYHGYALAATSPFKGRASDGTDPGVDFAALDAAFAPRAGPEAPSGLQVR